MNERTQELIKQFATDLLNRSGYDMREYEPFLEEAEKFAELIVKECMSLAQSHPSQIEDFAAGIDSVRENIKEHFGVE